jgi:hypothetical protein
MCRKYRGIVDGTTLVDESSEEDASRCAGSTEALLMIQPL